MNQAYRYCSVLLIIFVLGLAGCASNNTGKIEGTKWTSAATKHDGKDIPAGTVTLDFDKSGKLKYIVGDKVYSGTYTLGMADYVTFHLEQELGGRKTHLERVKIENSVLTLIDSNGEGLKFERM